MLTTIEAERVPAALVDARQLAGYILERLRERAAAVAAGEAEPDDELIAEMEIAERLAGERGHRGASVAS
jgi:hypothetical protein